jgi:hypothetical protein
MKTLFLLLTLIIVSYDGYSKQTSLSTSMVEPDSVFTFSIDGFTDYIVVHCDTLSQRDMFWKTIDWINKTYTNPNEVLLSSVEGDYIIFRGVGERMVSVMGLGSKIYFDVRYRIMVSFKEGRYKFDVETLESYSTGSTSVPSGWYDMKINNVGETYYKKNGEIRDVWKSYETEIPNYFNRLNSSLKNYILQNEKTSKSNDW